MSKIIRILYLFILFSLLFLAGYYYGAREEANKYSKNINIIEANKSNINLLRDVKRYQIKGYINSQTLAVFGEMFTYTYYNSKNQPTTEILFSLSNVPLSLKNQSLQLDIPNKLDIYSAFLNKDGTDFDYTKLGTITLDSPSNNNNRNGDFALTLKYSILDEFNLKRFTFEIKNKINSSIFTVDDPNLPIIVRSKPSSLFWVEF
jgi:hypothetical protein